MMMTLIYLKLVMKCSVNFIEFKYLRIMVFILLYHLNFDINRV